MPWSGSWILQTMGDVCRVLSFGFWWYWIGHLQMITGVSQTSMELLCVVCWCRHLHVFWTWTNAWEFVIQIWILTVSTLIVYALRSINSNVPATAEATVPSTSNTISSPSLTSPTTTYALLVEWKRYLVVCSILAVLIHLHSSGTVLILVDELEVHWHHHTWLDLFWIMSIFLEPMAIVPQLRLWGCYHHHHHHHHHPNLRYSTMPKAVVWAMGMNAGSTTFYVLAWMVPASLGRTYEPHPLLHLVGFCQWMLYGRFLYVHASQWYRIGVGRIRRKKIRSSTDATSQSPTTLDDDDDEDKAQRGGGGGGGGGAAAATASALAANDNDPERNQDEPSDEYDPFDVMSTKIRTIRHTINYHWYVYGNLWYDWLGVPNHLRFDSATSSTYHRLPFSSDPNNDDNADGYDHDHDSQLELVPTTTMMTDATTATNITARFKAPSMHENNEETNMSHHRDDSEGSLRHIDQRKTTVEATLTLENKEKDR